MSKKENMDELEDRSIVIRGRKRRRKSLKRSAWVRHKAGFYHTIFVELKMDRDISIVILG